jgi:transcriptional regulator with XRE-family HTH domain
MDPETTGQRIARARRRRGLSQAVLAGLVGRSESWLSQVERGKRSIDSHAVLTRLAGVLRIEVEEITGPPGNSKGDSRTYEPAKPIEQAMMRYDMAGVGADADAEHLEAMARTAYRDYQATRYDSATRLLPGLIRSAEASGATIPDAWKLRALVYDVAAALLNRVGEPFLAWMAADRAMSAAQQTGEAVLAAAAARGSSGSSRKRGKPSPEAAASLLPDYRAGRLAAS